MKKFIFGVIAIIIVGIVVVAIPKHKKGKTSQDVEETEKGDNTVNAREDDSDRLAFWFPTMIPLIMDLSSLQNNSGNLILQQQSQIIQVELCGTKSVRRPYHIVLTRFILDQIYHKHKRQTQC